MIYETPEDNFERIHQIRPRFKNDIENVLIFIASEISRLPRMKQEDFKKELNLSIRRYPGNSSKADATINNWRTEISSLFGLLRYNDDEVWPSKLCQNLAKNEDLPEFFRYFLYKFEYPGFHLTNYNVAAFINNNIYFKPARFILKFLKYAEEQVGVRYPVNKAELTHIVFNDLRFTTGEWGVKEAFRILQQNRQKGLEYDWDGDTVRYAGDILYYMEIAGLLVCHDSNSFYINKYEFEIVEAFVSDESRFEPFAKLYDQDDLESKEVNQYYDAWFKYVNSHIGDKNIFKTDLSSFIETSIETGSLKEYQNKFLSRLKEDGKLKNKEIGDFGEALILDHEKMSLKLNDKEDIIHLVSKISHMYVGYDIDSRDIMGKKKCVEVKTTISQKKLNFRRFHLTDNEWNTADSNGDIYYVYRLMVSQNEISLFIIRDPVKKYKNGLVEMSLNKGADIMFTEKAGEWEDLLSWED